jgi:branched-subunit amino acid transport protein
MSAPLSDLEIGLALAGLALTTLVTRSGMFVLPERFKLSARIESALRYAPACALAALVVPDLLMRGGQIDLSLANPKPLAALAAGACMWWRPNIVGCIVVGFAAFAIGRWLAG